MRFEDQFILIPGTAIGDVQIRYYGIIIVTAMLIAAWIAARLARRQGLDPDHVWGGLTWAIFPGIIAARLWFVLFPPVSLTAGCAADYVGPLPCRDAIWHLENFFNLQNGAIAIWSGGLHIYGAILGGLFGAWLYFGPWHNRTARLFHYIFLPVNIVFSAIGWFFSMIWQRLRGQEVTPYRIPRFEKVFPDEGLPLLPWLDIAGVTLPLAQAIGRWANFVNQELYGTPTDLPWGIQIGAEARVPPYESLVEYPAETGFHPLFLYESIWNLIAFFVLLRLYTNFRDRFNAGDFFLLYLIQYAFVRFFLEFLRIEKALLPGTDINSSQVLAAVVFVVALVVFVVRRNSANAGDANTSEAATA